jgi:hypothetical protein
VSTTVAVSQTDDDNVIDITANTASGDLGVLLVAVSSGVSGVPTPPTGFTTDKSQQNVGSNQWVAVMSKVLDGTETTLTVGNYTSGNRRIRFLRLTSDQSGSWSVDGTATSAESDAAGSIGSGSITTTKEAVLVALTNWSASIAASDDTPTYSNSYASTNYERFRGISAYREVASAGTYSTTVTLDPDITRNLAIVHVAYRKGTAATHATPTPSVVAGVAAVSAPSLSTGSKPTPTAVAAVGAISAPTVQVGSTVSPAAVAGVASVGAPTVVVVTHVTVTPGAVDAVAEVLAMDAETNSTVDPSVVATLAAISSPTITLSAVVAPSTVGVVGGVGSASLVTSSRVTPATVAGAATVSNATVAVGIVVAPGVVQVVGAVGSATITTGSTVTPSVVAAVTSVPAPQVVQPATVLVGTVAGVATVPAVIVGVGVEVSTATVAGVAAVGETVVVIYEEIGVRAGGRPVSVTAVADEDVW